MPLPILSENAVFALAFVLFRTKMFKNEQRWKRLTLFWDWGCPSLASGGTTCKPRRRVEPPLKLRSRFRYSPAFFGPLAEAQQGLGSNMHPIAHAGACFVNEFKCCKWFCCYKHFAFSNHLSFTNSCDFL